MIITLNTRSEFIPGTLIADKNKGNYCVVLYQQAPLDKSIRYYKVKSLNLSKYSLIRKLQLYIIKNSFK